MKLTSRSWACLYVFLCLPTLVISFGFATVPLLGAGFAGIYSAYEYVQGTFRESCSTKWITPNISGLSNDFDKHLYGQHLVQEMILKAIRIHLKKHLVDKPLVMSFHGWTGGGKNFVSKIIADNMYKKGSSSKFVHWLIASVDFPHKDKVAEYKDSLQRWIKGNVSECELSVFIFDEVDKIPSGVLEAVKPFMDYYEHIGGTDFRRSIFIFLSNTGGRAIMQKMMEFWKDGKKREDITYLDLEDLVSKGAFNEEGGLFRTSMIDKNLVDYYVPFLPLERKHVKQCIRDELLKRGALPDNHLIERIADEMPYFPEDTKLFSKVGCKRVAQRVDYHLD